MFSIPHSDLKAPGIPCDWSIVTVYFNTYVSQSRAESNKHAKHVKPSYTTPFDVRHFHPRYGFLGSGRGSGRMDYLKRYSEATPFSLLVAFPSSAFSLLAGFFRSSALTESLVQASFVHDAEVYSDHVCNHCGRKISSLGHLFKIFKVTTFLIESGTSIKSTLATPERASSS